MNPNENSGALSPDSKALGEQLDATDIHRLLEWYFAKQTTTRRSSAHDAA